MLNETLYQKAKDAQKFSYSPYSKITVGAALLTASGNIYTGANIENASFGATICAERTAIYSAVLNGEREFKEIVITSNLEQFIFPCGICLQVMAEFAKSENSSNDLKIYATNPKGEMVVKGLRELLPFGFGI